MRKDQKKHKYIFVVGGVMSGVGKGIATSSIGTLLQAKGFNVNLAKVDPYLNVDAGTMNPTEHGEVFVINSGLETDQDMGNYERFLNRDLDRDDYMTSGMVYQTVIERERNLGYKGKCVEAIPDIRDEIVARFEHAARQNESEISVIEIGGTVGDYQNIMFIEAARVLKIKHPEDVIFIMVSYLPIPSKIGEMKSRPTQNAVRQLAGYGVYTDIIIARSEVPVDQKRKEKLAVSCSIPADHVISAPDIDSVYDVPLNFERDKLGDIILKTLHLKARTSVVSKRGLADWKGFVKNIDKARAGTQEVNIAIVGKYFSTGDFVLTDAYVSVLEALKFSGFALGVRVKIHTINAGDYEKKNPDYEALEQYDGILVPGGFGNTGIEGKINVISYARTHGIPFFGLCYGMQLMTIEYARSVLKLGGAHTAEINPKSTDLVIDIMPEQKKLLAEERYGATMRLGAYEAVLTPGTRAYEAYVEAGWAYKVAKGEKCLVGGEKGGSKTSSTYSGPATVISERHRHRYEVNPAYIERLTAAGFVFSATSPNGILMEIAELPESVHPFFLGTQFHPEFLARPLRPHPLYKAAMGRRKYA